MGPSKAQDTLCWTMVERICPEPCGKQPGEFDRPNRSREMPSILSGGRSCLTKEAGKQQYSKLQ